MGTYDQIMAQTHTHNRKKKFCFCLRKRDKNTSRGETIWRLEHFFHVIIQITWTAINTLVNVTGWQYRCLSTFRVHLCFLRKKIEKSGCETETERVSEEKKKLQESATLTIKYAMREEKQHQQMPRIGKVSPSKSETKCLLFIVEMDVICAQNISICERVWADMCVSLCVCVFWSLKSFRRADWTTIKSELYVFSTVECLEIDARSVFGMYRRA